MRRRTIWPWLAAGTAAAVVVVLAPATVAQPGPPSTTTPTPSATVGPLPSVAGRWSVTRTWYRRCPGCAEVVVRTTPWLITQTGADVRVDRGLAGTIVAVPGGARLSLGGMETDGFDVYRFWYGTLRVTPDGRLLEGQFAGSETVQNPCAGPPIVTCFVSGGWIRGTGVDAAPAPTSSPTGALSPPPFPTVPPPSAAPPATGTAPATASRTPVPSTTPTAAGTVRPLAPLFLPLAAP